MTDIVHTAIKSVSYNRYLALGLAIPVLVGVVGCTPLLMGKVQSSVTGERSTAEQIVISAKSQVRELESQIETLARRRDDIIATANEEVEMANLKTEQNYALANAVWTAVQANPMIQTALGAAGLGAVTTMIGAVWDNRRKDKVIHRVKAGAAVSDAGSPAAPSPDHQA